MRLTRRDPMRVCTSARASAGDTSPRGTRAVSRARAAVRLRGPRQTAVRIAHRGIHRAAAADRAGSEDAVARLPHLRRDRADRRAHLLPQLHGRALRLTRSPRPHDVRPREARPGTRPRERSAQRADQTARADRAAPLSLAEQARRPARPHPFARALRAADGGRRAGREHPVARARDPVAQVRARLVRRRGARPRIQVRRRGFARGGRAARRPASGRRRDPARGCANAANPWFGGELDAAGQAPAEQLAALLAPSSAKARPRRPDAARVRAAPPRGRPPGRLARDALVPAPHLGARGRRARRGAPAYLQLLANHVDHTIANALLTGTCASAAELAHSLEARAHAGRPRPLAEDGSGRTARRRCRARLQQPAHGDPRLRGRRRQPLPRARRSTRTCSA